MNDNAVTDLSFLREIAMGDDDIIIETTQVFLDELPQNLKGLRENFANQEWEKIGKLAHKIKPNMAYMGMKRAQKLILNIEQQAKSEEIDEDFGNDISEFIQLCNQASNELNEKLEELKSK
ncbi:MAG TPA: Hpt domain-containing protein [Balneolaceae bacterium]|nr:Hpt domain-containing protein [Balneolaceae bacterium]